MVELGAVVTAIGLVMVLGSGRFGRWSARHDPANRFVWTPLHGAALVRLRQGSCALVGAAFLVFGVAILAHA